MIDRRRTDTRRRILELAERMVMQRGYHAFSFRHIAEALGVKSAAIHFHFRTKPLLVVAVLERYGAKFDTWTASVAAEPSPARLRSYFDVGRRVVADQRVCALGMINNELQTVPPEVREAVVAVQERVLAFYVATLEEGRQTGELAFEGPSSDKAMEIACALVGAQGLSRALGPAAYERVVTQLERSLASPVSAAPSSDSPARVHSTPAP